MRILIFYIALCMLLSSQLFAQRRINQPIVGKNDTIKMPISIEPDGEVLTWVLLNEVEVTAYRKFATPQDRANFERLKYNVLKVMPYAVFAKNRYIKLERDLAVTSDKREQKKLVKDCDNEIKTMFNTQVKELTVTQGQILTKLINRELDKTTYDIVKETQGGVKAFVYQNIARVFGHNLKSLYNPTEDRDIEAIIRNSVYANQ